MKDYSLTIAGLIAAVAVPLFVQFGFSDGCANELSQVAASLPGIITAWYGRVRQGDIDVLGVRK